MLNRSVLWVIHGLGIHQVASFLQVATLFYPRPNPSLLLPKRIGMNYLNLVLKDQAIRFPEVVFGIQTIRQFMTKLNTDAQEILTTHLIKTNAFLIQIPENPSQMMQYQTAKKRVRFGTGQKVK